MFCRVSFQEDGEREDERGEKDDSVSLQLDRS